MSTHRDIEGEVNAHLSGGRWMVVALSAFFAAYMLAGIHIELKQQNELRKQEIEVAKHQTDIMKRQYALDSAKWQYMRDSLKFSKVR